MSDSNCPTGDDVQALVVTARATGWTEAVGTFRNDLISAVEALRPNDADPRTVPIADKIILTLAEASRSLTSRATIYARSSKRRNFVRGSSAG